MVFTTPMKSQATTPLITAVAMPGPNRGRNDTCNHAIRLPTSSAFDAFARGDTETFIRFLADDYCAINDDGSFANRAQVVAMAKASASTLNIAAPSSRIWPDRCDQW